LEKSYRVHRDGPVPAFVLEITSEDTRAIDLQAKTLHYAAVGVREMLIIDFWPEDGGAWQPLGYRHNPHGPTTNNVPALRPKTSGKYISQATVGRVLNSPDRLARIRYVYS